MALRFVYRATPSHPFSSMDCPSPKKPHRWWLEHLGSTFDDEINDLQHVDGDFEEFPWHQVGKSMTPRGKRDRKIMEKSWKNHGKWALQNPWRQRWWLLIRSSQRPACLFYADIFPKAPAFLFLASWVSRSTYCSTRISSHDAFTAVSHSFSYSQLALARKSFQGSGSILHALDPTSCSSWHWDMLSNNASHVTNYVYVYIYIYMIIYMYVYVCICISIHMCIYICIYTFSRLFRILLHTLQVQSLRRNDLELFSSRHVHVGHVLMGPAGLQLPEILVGGEWLPSILFSQKYWEFLIIPIDFHIFQRGWKHQPESKRTWSWEVGAF